MQVIVACGPYMLTNGSYKPFYDLIEYAVKNKPHALILIGPIVDTNHPDIMSFKVSENFTECFKNLVDTAMTKLKGLVLFVYSSITLNSSLHYIC